MSLFRSVTQCSECNCRARRSGAAERQRFGFEFASDSADADALSVQSVDSWLTTPLSSSFADFTLRIEPNVHRWLDVGALHAGAVNGASAPAKLLGSASGADYHPQGFIDDLQSEAVFTSVKISPRGVAAPGSAITAAVCVTDSRGGARIYTQNRAQSGASSAWSMRIDMGSYLLKGYLASHWQSLAPFDSAVALPAHMPSISSFAHQNRRRQLVSVEAAAWSGMVRLAGGDPFVMLALGSRAGVVSIWRIPLMVDPHSAEAHPQLLCSVTPAGEQVLISQLAFSPMYFDATRQAQVCSLAVGTSAGRVHLYGLLAAATVPMTIHPLSSHRLGSKLMSISALSWSQILGGPAVYSQCAWCFSSECTHRPAAASHAMSVHHTLAVGCGGHIQVITLHPDLYAQAEAAASPAAVAAAAAAAARSGAAAAAPAAPSAHPSLCHVFTAIRAHASTINSFVWNIQAAPPLHNVAAAVDRPGADGLIPLACHHVQLLSSSNDDTVHRWVIKDRIGSRGEGALVLLDSNRRADLEVWHPEVTALAAEADPDYASRSALLQFPTQERVHGASGLLRSADGMLLYTYDLLVAGSDSGAERKRQFMSMLRAAPFPFVDLTDDVREQCAQAALEYSSISLGEAESNVALDAPPVASPDALAAEASQSQRSAMDIMQEELQEERRQEAAASRTARPVRAAAAAVAVATAPCDSPVKMELDLGDSPDPRSLTTALATPSTKQKKEKATPKSKQKDKRKRKKFSELDAPSDEESEDEWKGGGGGDDEDEDQSSSSESESTDDDSAIQVLKPSSATKVKRAPRASPGWRNKKPRQGDRKFAVAANVPIPQPTQTEALFKARLPRQVEAMWRQAVLLWRDTVQQAARVRLCSVAGPVPATALPSSLSFFSIYTFFTGLLNPLHLSIPPSLSAVATKLVKDEEQSKLLMASSNPNSSRRAPDPNPETTFSLWWAMLPHIIPTDAVYGGYAQIFRDESEQGEQVSGEDKPPLPPLYPIDAFALPIHRQLPFIFGADSLMYTAENCVSELYPDQSAFTTLWLDSLPASLTPDFAGRRMQLRLALALLQMALSARSPYLALDISNQPRAHSLQQRLIQALHLQYLRQRMEQLTTTLRAAPDATARAQAALSLTQTQPLASLLLTADWLLHSLLSSRVWDHPNALSLLRMLQCLYSAFPLLCQTEIQWLQDLGLPDESAAASGSAAAAPSAAAASAVVDAASAASAAAPSWQQKLSLVASSWRSTPREKCVLCASIVPLTSSDTATCEAKHAVPRCRRTLASITGMQSTDACGVCGGAILRNAADNDSHLCPLCIANTHPTD